VNSEKNTERALSLVARTNDPDSLQRIANNAKMEKNYVVERAARLRLYMVKPSAERGTFEHAVWQSIFALEDMLTSERGKTTRLSRTRQKITKDGELKCVSDLIEGKESDGFKMLVERDLIELTFEAVALRFPEKFSTATLEAARRRLIAVGGLASS
jgi:hypothetical protein